MNIKVSEVHTIFYETYGTPNGRPYLFIHGGPGLGFSENDKRFFDSDKHFVIFYDQRGCGRSTPIGELSENTTEDLIEDITKLLNHLGISKVNVFAGSWGATLAVLYTANNQCRVKSLLLRGFFSATTSTMNLYLRGGIKSTHLESWSRVSSLVPEKFQDSVPEYFYQKIIDDEYSYKYAYEWSRYGLSLSRAEINESTVEKIMKSYVDNSMKIKIELHFALNNFFITDGYIYEQASMIKGIPTTIVHGKHDHICPLSDAEMLNSRIVGSNLVTTESGHSAGEMEEELKNLLI